MPETPAPASPATTAGVTGDLVVVDTTNWPTEAVESLRAYDAEILRLQAAGADVASLWKWLETRNVLVTSFGQAPHRPIRRDWVARKAVLDPETFRREAFGEWPR